MLSPYHPHVMLQLLIPSYTPHSGVKLSSLTDVVSQKAISIMSSSVWTLFAVSAAFVLTGLVANEPRGKERLHNVLLQKLMSFA